MANERDVGPRSLPIVFYKMNYVKDAKTQGPFFEVPLWYRKIQESDAFDVLLSRPNRFNESFWRQIKHIQGYRRGTRITYVDPKTGVNER